MEACCSRFTAAEGGTRLSVTAGTKNTLAVEYASFISTRLIYEEAYRIRGSLFDGCHRSVYIARASRVPCVSYELSILTDLSVIQAVEYTDVYDWYAELDSKEVLVCTSAVLRQILDEEMLSMSIINVLVIDSCHLVCQDENLQHIMQLYKSCEQDSKPRILALTYPLFTSRKDNENAKDSLESITNIELKTNEINDDIENTENLDEIKDNDNEMKFQDERISKNVESQKDKRGHIEEMGAYENWDDFDMYEKLEWKIEELEEQLCCQMDLAEDIDGGKRMSSTMVKPKELIIEYSAQLGSEARSEEYMELDKYMRDAIKEALDFLHDHRYDPTEIYGDDLYEEFLNIPNPVMEPRSLFNQFLYILDQLGPYGADKAAFSLLTKLEKLKIKVPYERHFLLLCICTTVFVKIRCHADSIFSKYECDWDKVRQFCTPKVLRLAEILEKFQPPDLIKELSKISENINDKQCVAIRQKYVKINNETILEDDGLSNSNTRSNNYVNLNASISETNEFVVNNEEIEDASCNTKVIFDKNEMINEIDKCDFNTLGNKIEDKINALDANLKDLDEFDYKNIIDDIKFNNVCDVKIKKSNSEDDKLSEINSNANIDKNENLESNKDINEDRRSALTKNINDKADPRLPLLPRRAGRPRGRGRPQRNTAARNQQNLQNPDALCGIVFMNEALMAKIMFMLIVDMSRSRPPLSMLSAVYCAAEEANRQGKKQEDVLNKFRMHESNLLLATTTLEEGVDLPRCNLVLRWDLPPSYRSYGLCRGRARSVRATCALLSTDERDTTNMLLYNLAVYRELDQIVTRKCGCGIQDEPPQSEEDHADNFTMLIKPYTPVDITIKNEVKTNEQIQYKSNITKHNSEKEICDKILENNDIIDIHNQNIDMNSNSSLRDSFSYFNNEISSKDNFNILETNSKGLNVLENNNEKLEISSANSECVHKSDSKDKKGVNDIAYVDLNTAIALINRYCGKLPSDTFTRLAPQWSIEEVQLSTKDGGMKKAYICTLRLPLNSPVKYNIVGHPMPTKVLARRMVALQACRILHKSGELDNQLMPIGKENFKTVDLDTATITTNDDDPNDSARPGTTKRRQYYYKRTAEAFTDCQPVIDTSDSEINSSAECRSPKTHPDSNAVELKNNVGKRNMLYAIVSKLWCALPERYNTRGRRLHAPQNAAQALGILMARDKPDNLQIPAFPVYTRSGEVRVSVEYVPDADVRMSPRRGRLIRRFMRFVFAEVLRVRRKGMKLQSEGSTHNNYYIVPTVKSVLEDGTTKIDIDWQFLELIYQHTEEKKHSDLEKHIMWHQDEEELDEDTTQENEIEKEPKEEAKVKKMENPLLKPGETFVFDPEVYREAVVTPWYRNQDQPQFFLVAEICSNLTPDSAFPSATHKSFREYYSIKYGVVLTQPNQPLLDVDHTSARLNLLTPRYVNRKGVALPVSSERTRRAKRDRLDQKQILVPELCRVHPFAAPLWFATVALPCVLYRINALLIADEIRRSVAIDVGLGVPKIDESTGFQWPPLDFGWSLAEVLNADTEKSDKIKKDDEKGQDKKEDKEKHTKDKTEQETKAPKDDDKETADGTNEKTINDILQEKEEAESGFEIGTWSNEMASSIPQSEEFDEYMEPLPSNLTFCTSVSGGTNWADPIQKPKSQFQPSRTFSMADSDCSYMSSDFDTDDSDLNSVRSDEDTDISGFTSSKNSNVAMGVRIEYKTAHEAEAVDLEQKKVKPAPQPDEQDDIRDRKVYDDFIRCGTAPEHYIKKFHDSVEKHKKDIIEKGHLIHHDKPIEEILPEKSDKEIVNISKDLSKIDVNDEYRKFYDEIFPYKNSALLFEQGKVSLNSIEKNKRELLSELKKSMNQLDLKRLECFSMVDVDIDAPNYVNEKVANVGFDKKDKYIEKVTKWDASGEFQPYYMDNRGNTDKEFDFDHQPDLEYHPGPSPSVILQALTMSNANDGINLERLETIGDSFLKFAITAYLYCAHPNVHEGKLSHMRSKQVSNLNLYRLGRNKRLGARMIASKFEPHDNWLPPCHKPPPTLHPRSGDSQEKSKQPLERTLDRVGCFIPYNLITQHSIPDKSIADCVEALIGAYLLECGPRGALLFMSWLGIKVLPKHEIPFPNDHPFVVAAETSGSSKEKPKLTKPKPTTCADGSDSDSDYSEDETCLNTERSDETRMEESEWGWTGRPVGSLKPYKQSDGTWVQPIFGQLRAPPSPLLRYIEDPEGELERMLSGYDALERTLQYRFKDRSLLLQAMTHASHHKNRLTDCYQRLEFLGDAILDYLITRHLYCDPRRHSPGALTDLRSALVNNTIFATLAAKHGFHKYFRHMSPGLNEVLTKYVKIQEENGHSISEEHYLIHEDEMEQAEDVEVPKALGDLFESVAGAIFLDSGMSLGAVWKSYVNLMGSELEAFSAAAPKSPVRELLEAEPDTAKFGKPERLADGRRVRVCVEVFGRGTFKGIGRNYRIAKGTAARCALRHLREHRR